MADGAGTKGCRSHGARSRTVHDQPSCSVLRGTAKRVFVRTNIPLVWLIGLAVLLSPPVPLGGAQESGGTRNQYEMPERLRREIAPAPSTPWRTPDLRQYTGVLKSTEPPLIDPQRRYELVELIDLAQRVNPETREPCQSARQAAIRVGRVDWEYYPG